MRIAYCSDLHLEFGDRSFLLPDADVLIIAGDICLGSDLVPDVYTEQAEYSKKFFVDISEKYRDVIYIPGNHEYYGGYTNMDDIDSSMQKFFLEYGICNIAYGQTINRVIGGVQFVGSTLWTDINKSDPLALEGHHYMNDYHKIQYDGYDLTPADTMRFHAQQRKYITDNIADQDKVVVVSHHAPNMKSIDHARQSGISYFYGCTDMDDIILDSPQIKYWIHGHTHTNSDYTIGETRVLSNCRGYVGYADTRNFVLKVIDL